MRSSIHARAVHRHRFWRRADRVARSSAGPRPPPPRSARRAPATSNGAPASRPTAASAGRHAGRDKRRHAPQSRLLVGESLSCRFGQREAGAAPPWSLRGELRDESPGGPPSRARRVPRRIDLKDAIIQAFADGFADKPGATFGTLNAVLAEKLPGYVRRTSTRLSAAPSTGPDSAATAPPNANDRASRSGACEPFSTSAERDRRFGSMAEQRTTNASGAPVAGDERSLTVGLRGDAGRRRVYVHGEGFLRRPRHRVAPWAERRST
jgi:hypothetical protein